jgi:hypothetical protein
VNSRSRFFHVLGREASSGEWLIGNLPSILSQYSSLYQDASAGRADRGVCASQQWCGAVGRGVPPYRRDMSSVYDDPEHWQERAEEARATAAYATDPSIKAVMLRVAEEYDRLVCHTQRSSSGSSVADDRRRHAAGRVKEP